MILLLDRFTEKLPWKIFELARWQSAHVFGIHTVCPDGITEITKGEPVHLSDTEKETIKGNIPQNVTSLAKENPNITVYYFFTP